MTMIKSFLNEDMLLYAKGVIGYGTKVALKEVQRSQKCEILNFKKQCRNFLACVIKKLQESFPLKHSFTGS